MSLKIETDTPSMLLKEIKSAIDSRHIETWSYDGAGDFTHTPAQWKDKAWLRPEVKQGSLELTVLVPRNVTELDPAVRGVYHGRFIEMLVTHFRTSFSKASAIP